MNNLKKNMNIQINMVILFIKMVKEVMMMMKKINNIMMKRKNMNRMMANNNKNNKTSEIFLNFEYLKF